MQTFVTSLFKHEEIYRLQRLLENRRRIQTAENQVKIHDMTLTIYGRLSIMKLNKALLSINDKGAKEAVENLVIQETTEDQNLISNVQNSDSILLLIANLASLLVLIISPILLFLADSQTHSGIPASHQTLPTCLPPTLDQFDPS
jgi:hypothetical protein